MLGMNELRVLNLYAGIGGNRKLWTGVEVTAVEWDPKIAAIYGDFFPDDTVIVANAHQYLLDHHTEFDFIWSSPPCPTHSKLNRFMYPQGVIRYPDMKLYEEIIFLQTWYKGMYCVENVVSYYNPLIKPFLMDRHYLWSNFYITHFRSIPREFDITNSKGEDRIENQKYLKMLGEFHDIVLPPGLGSEVSIKMLRNCVYPPLGKHIMDCARGNTQLSLTSF